MPRVSGQSAARPHSSWVAANADAGVAQPVLHAPQHADPAQPQLARVADLDLVEHGRERAVAQDPLVPGQVALLEAVPERLVDLRELVLGRVSGSDSASSAMPCERANATSCWTHCRAHGGGALEQQDERLVGELDVDPASGSRRPAAR